MTRRDAITLAAILAVFLAVCAAMGPFHPDRSFVAYRYAENLANGHGLAFNPGDAPGEGYGSALWVVLCAALHRAGLSLPTAAPLLSLLFGALTLIVLWLALRRSGCTGALVATGLAATTGPLAVAAMSGEGVALTALLTVAMVMLVSRAEDNRRPWMLAALLGFLLAACGNAWGIVLPVAFLLRLRELRERRGSRAAVLIAGAVYVAGAIGFHLWRTKTFGSFTVDAPGFGGGRASFADLFVSQPHDMAPFGWLYLILFVLGVAGALASRSRPGNWLAVGVSLVAGAITLSARDPLPGLASSAALVPLLLIPVAGLVEAVPRAVRSRGVDAALIAALMLVAIGGAADMRIFARHQKDTHDVTLRPLGEWMAAWRPAGTLLCAQPGAVPYYSRWRSDVIAGNTKVAASTDVVMLTSEGMFDAVTDETQARIGAAISGSYRLLAGLRLDWTRDRALLVHAQSDIPELTDAERAAFPAGLGTVTRLNR